MRIDEIIVEGPFSAIGKIASKVGNVAADVRKDYRAGYNAVDKALSPSKWGSSDTSDSTSGKVDDLTIKNVLKKVTAKERLYIDDVNALKAARAKVESGEISFRGNKNNLILALRAVYNSKPINDNQMQLISQLASNL
jgi:hypothetical protein